MKTKEELSGLLSKAIALVAKAFEGKFDKGGNPYILHCLRVMYGVDQSDTELMIIAILHDFVEDTDHSIYDLAAMGFSERVCVAVGILTHKKEIPYDDYIKAIALNEDAKKVKIADLIDNSNITRIKGLRKKDVDRIEKYHRAYTYLQN